MPHPNKQILSSGASSLIFAHDISLTTVYSEKGEKNEKKEVKEKRKLE
jgi:hypothetical protein